jgi:hypothetical protein
MASLAKNLQDTNLRLRSCLDRIAPGSGQTAISTRAHMAMLLSELLRAGAWLRAEPLPATGSDPELNGAIAEYRRNAERLRDLLPSIHSQLLAERARIETQRARMQSAAEWARASRQIL